jgi:hypothetical protein
VSRDQHIEEDMTRRNEVGGEQDEQTDDRGLNTELWTKMDRRPDDQRKSRKRGIGIAIGALLLVALVGAAVWWFVIRDDGSTTTAEQVPEFADEITEDGGVRIIQIPSLTASATIDGVSTEGPIEITLGSSSELVVTVLNDGNLTMDDISVTLELIEGDTVTTGPDDCAFPSLDPDESADCTLEFTPTEAMTGFSAEVLGFGPQQQEVASSVDVVFG